MIEANRIDSKRTIQAGAERVVSTATWEAYELFHAATVLHARVDERMDSKLES